VRFQKSQLLCNQANPDSFAKTPGVGGYLAVLAGVLLTFSQVAAVSQTPSSRQPDAGSIEGRLRNSNGEPVAGASVFLEDTGHSTLAETKTKEDGGFVLADLHPGAYALRAEKSGLRSAAVASVVLSRGERKHIDLVLQSSESVTSPMQFADKPDFTVAGVTDGTDMGGHGSDTNLRTSEALSRETAAFKSGGGTGTTLATAPANREMETKLRAALASAHDPSEKAEIYRLLGDLDEQLGDPLQAVREYESAARLEPSEQNYFNWGAELLLHKAPYPAVEIFTKGSQGHPNSARILAGLGAALYANGSYSEAARRLCEASDLNPADPAPYVFLGKMQKAAPDPLPCAEEKLSRFAREQPANALANYYYAVMLWKSDRDPANSTRTAQAAALLDKAIGIDPKLAEAYIQLGIISSARGDHLQAINAYKQGIEANPQSGEAHYRLGLAYKRIGQDAKAQQELQLYKQIDQTETAAVERQRRELRQFMIILKDQPAPPTPQ
jgi:tetratricopeptide (TPR) repeat protein